MACTSRVGKRTGCTSGMGKKMACTSGVRGEDGMCVWGEGTVLRSLEWMGTQ